MAAKQEFHFHCKNLLFLDRCTNMFFLHKAHNLNWILNEFGLNQKFQTMLNLLGHKERQWAFLMPAARWPRPVSTAITPFESFMCCATPDRDCLSRTLTISFPSEMYSALSFSAEFPQGNKTWNPDLVARKASSRQKYIGQCLVDQVVPCRNTTVFGGRSSVRILVYLYQAHKKLNADHIDIEALLKIIALLGLRHAPSKGQSMLYCKIKQPEVLERFYYLNQ